MFICEVVAVSSSTEASLQASVLKVWKRKFRGKKEACRYKQHETELAVGSSAVIWLSDSDECIFTLIVCSVLK